MRSALTLAPLVCVSLDCVAPRDPGEILWGRGKRLRAEMMPSISRGGPPPRNAYLETQHLARFTGGLRGIRCIFIRCRSEPLFRPAIIRAFNVNERSVSPGDN